MEETGPRNVGDRRPDLLPGMDHIDPEGVHSIPPDIIPIDPRDEHLPLVIVHKQTANHVALCLAVQ